MLDTTSLEQDLYPSRVQDRPQWIPRHDPVVYGRVDDGPLDQGQLHFYEKNGYLLFESLFSAGEVERMREALRQAWNAYKTSDEDYVVREPNSDTIRSIFRVHKNNPVFREIAYDDRIVSRVRQILGSDVMIHQSRINYKSGFHGKEFYWHSDFETWHVEDGMPRMRALSVSIALEDNYPFNGPLMLIPGSHHVFISCVGKTPDAHYKTSLKKQMYGVPDEESLRRLVQEHGIDTALGNAGSVLFFDANIMHGSNGNITPFPRSNVFIVYNSVDNRLVQPFSGLERRPVYLAERDD